MCVSSRDGVVGLCVQLGSGLCGGIIGWWDGGVTVAEI